MTKTEILALIVFTICFNYLIYLVTISNDREQERNTNRHMFIEKNSLGCSRFKYNESYYWKCPKDIDVDQIEHRYGKYDRKVSYEPVIN